MRRKSEKILLLLMIKSTNPYVDAVRHRCLAAVQSDTFHRLSHNLKWNLYQTISSEYGMKGQTLLAYWSVAAANYVIPIWEAGFPNIMWPQNLLALAQASLDGSGDIEALEDKVNDAYFDLDQGVPVSGIAALVHSAGVAGYNAGGDVVYKEHIPSRLALPALDDDFGFAHGYTRDTANAAVIAFSGRWSRAENDSVKRLQFWTAWLTSMYENCFFKSLKLGSEYRSS